MFLLLFLADAYILQLKKYDMPPATTVTSGVSAASPVVSPSPVLTPVTPATPPQAPIITTTRVATPQTVGVRPVFGKKNLDLHRIFNFIITVT